MNIAVWHNLPPGGARRSIAAQVSGLIQRGHHVEVWSPPIDLQGDLMPFDSRAIEHCVPLSPNPIGLGSPISRFRRYFTDLRYRVDAMRAHSTTAAAEMRAHGMEVLLATNCSQFHSPFIGHYFSGPKLLYLQDPKRMLYTADERLIWRAPTPMPDSTGLRPKLKAKVRDYIDIRDARELAELDYWNTAVFDRLLVNSYFSRESMLRAYNLDSRVCYLGIDTELFKVGSGQKQPYVIGVGSMTPNKNIEFIIEALATLEEPRPKLVWIGQFADPEYRAAILKLAGLKRVDLSLHLADSDEELVDLLGRATAFVYAPRLEPFGFAPLEANSCGTVAVGVPEGGLRESISDGLNGFLVDPNPQAFGAKIAWLLANPEVAKSMGLQAAEHVRSNWTWDRSIERLEKELDGVRG